MNVRILTSEAEANNFLSMKRMEDFPNELLWESLKLKTRVLCPLPANNGGDNQQQVMPPNTLLNLAIPLIDSLHIEFAMIKERTLFNKVTRRYDTMVLPGECVVVPSTPDRSEDLNTPEGFVKSILSAGPIELNEKNLFTNAGLLSWVNSPVILTTGSLFDDFSYEFAVLKVSAQVMKYISASLGFENL